MKQLRVLLSLLDGMLVHRRVTPSSMSPVPIYTPGWRETMWGKVSCLRKQHDGRDWSSKDRPSDLKSNALTTTPPCPLDHLKEKYIYIICRPWSVRIEKNCARGLEYSPRPQAEGRAQDRGHSFSQYGPTKAGK